MFIQVITGTTSDREGLVRQADRWEQEIRPGATGFLGSTGGVTDDGRFIVAARFESEDAARRNSAREEQGAWWAETEKYLSDVAFHDSTDITVMGGGSNDALFVQVMRGRVTDTARAAQLIARMGEFEALLRQYRPDVIGDVTVMHADGTYTDIIYFTSEEAAREGEKQELPAEAHEMFGDMMETMPVDEYLDLRDPWLR
jgi:heme-degrading monooxygenase HmoA